MIDNIMKEKQLAKLAGGDLHEVLSTNYRYLTLPYLTNLTLLHLLPYKYLYLTCKL